MTTQELWNLYSDDLKRFIISKVKNESVADDILQDSFLKVHLKLHSLRDFSKATSWFFSVARNAIMDFFKAHKIESNEPIELSENSFEKNEHTEQDCLIGILQTLPKKYRNPIFLSDIKGIKQTEVAKQLKLPLPTVKSQIQRGRKLIAQGFMDCCGFVMNDQGVLVGEIQDKEDCKICS